VIKKQGKIRRVNKKASKEILIISSIYDFSTDKVILKLIEADVSYIRLNREHLKDYRLTLDPIASTLIINNDGNIAEIGSDLRSVWFRQPVFLRNTPAHPLSVEDQLDRSQWSAFIRALSLFENAAWMNFPARTYLAESKPYQLRIAAQCGFRIPVTLATNDVCSIKRNFHEDIIIKSLDTILLHEESTCLFTYTTIGSISDIDDINIANVPLLAQQLVSNKTDLRVTIVGEEVFAVRILSGGKGIEGDWRVVPRSEIEYESIKLDNETEICCRSLVSNLGIPFGAIDLLENPDAYSLLRSIPLASGVG
jgi:hypothetical protein